MGIKKIIKNINHFFGQEEPEQGNLEIIDELLEELTNKIKKLEHKLENEDKKSKRKHLKLDIRIARAELKKASERRQELDI